MLDNIFIKFVVPLAVGIAVAVFFALLCTKKYKNSDFAQKIKPIKVVFYILIALEIVKIFYFIGKNGFEPNRYPIVFCSFVFFTYPLIFCKRNKFTELSMGISIIPSFVVYALFIVVQPQFKIEAWSTFIVQMHSYFFHSAMIAVAIYLVTCKLYEFKLKKFFEVFLVIAAYVVVCNIISLLIGGNLSYFGPTSPITDLLYSYVGYTTGNILIIVLLFILTFVSYLLIDLLKPRKKAVSPATKEKFL